MVLICLVSIKGKKKQAAQLLCSQNHHHPYWWLWDCGTEVGTNGKVQDKVIYLSGREPLCLVIYTTVFYLYLIYFPFLKILLLEKQTTGGNGKPK